MLVVMDDRLVVEVLHQVDETLIANEGTRGVDLLDIVRGERVTQQGLVDSRVIVVIFDPAVVC